MIVSMTGFGRAVAEYKGKKVTVECRSLNSKQLDLNLRIHSSYKEKESEIRTIINKLLERGKVDLTISVEGEAGEATTMINQEMALHYYQELKALQQRLQDDTSNLLEMVMRLPDVVKQNREELNEEEWKVVEKAIQEAAHQLTQFRILEGKSLAKDLSTRLNSIREQVKQVPPFELERKEATRNRLNKALEEAMGKDNIDTNRFEQELIYYLEKFDISEEKVRLATHLDHFEACMESAENEGRKLGFIAQEIGREINTMGSKANHAGIQRLVVQMKDDLEKVKEQVLNVL